MKYLQKVASLPQELEEGVLYLNSTDGSVALKKKEEPTPPTPTVEVVDLGLSVNWMTCNIGAKKPEEDGLFFQWGDTVGRTADEVADKPCSWSTAPFNNGSSSYDSTYFASVKDEVCPNGVLASQYDAASVATDGVAHMPTKADFEELTANTTSEWTQVNDVDGVKLTSKKEGYTDKYIFIPASGLASNGSVEIRGSYGFVWSSSLNTSRLDDAWSLRFSSNMNVAYGYRCDGYSVRGVVSKN